MGEIPKSTPLVLTGEEKPFMSGGALAQPVREFWRWCCSDLLSNSTRGIFAEYLVGVALDLISGVRNEWADCDFVTADGWKIEVKSSAYLQTWSQERLSQIQFGIAPTQRLPDGAIPADPTPRRRADAYVFCLLQHKDMETVNPLNLDQWRFFVVLTKKLNDVLPNSKTVSLAALQRIAGEGVHYSELKAAVCGVLGCQASEKSSTPP